jgi:hypothetical protein
MVPSRSSDGRKRAARLRRRRDRDDFDGETVVRAVVHARLLGLRLLTLDARVVVSPPGVAPHGRVSDNATIHIAGVPDDQALPAASRARFDGRNPTLRLADAVQLLAQGNDTLRSVRRFR